MRSASSSDVVLVMGFSISSLQCNARLGKGPQALRSIITAPADSFRREPLPPPGSLAIIPPGPSGPGAIGLWKPRTVGGRTSGKETIVAITSFLATTRRVASPESEATGCGSSRVRASDEPTARDAAASPCNLLDRVAETLNDRADLRFLEKARSASRFRHSPLASREPRPDESAIGDSQAQASTTPRTAGPGRFTFCHLIEVLKNRRSGERES